MYLTKKGPFELGPGIMERVYKLTSKNYFHGFLSTQQAENALISRGKIGFLSVASNKLK